MPSSVIDSGDFFFGLGFELRCDGRSDLISASSFILNQFINPEIWLSQLRFYWGPHCYLEQWSSLIKTKRVLYVQLQINQYISHPSKTFQGENTILKNILHSEPCARCRVMADKHELQIKHLILIILHAVELSIGILAVRSKCLLGRCA